MKSSELDPEARPFNGEFRSELLLFPSDIYMDLKELKLYYHPKDRLRLTVGEEKSYSVVKPAWASPLTYPNRYLSLLNSKGEEIAMVPDLNELTPESRAAVSEELSRRYLTATITAVEFAKVEFGATYWHVDTDRGRRDFVTQSLQENAQWMGEGHLMLIDVDGNRFEILDVSKLDEKSRRFIEQIV